MRKILSICGLLAVAALLAGCGGGGGSAGLSGAIADAISSPSSDPSFSSFSSSDEAPVVELAALSLTDSPLDDTDADATPVSHNPEPGSLLLMASGLAGFAGVYFKRFKA